MCQTLGLVPAVVPSVMGEKILSMPQFPSLATGSLELQPGALCMINTANSGPGCANSMELPSLTLGCDIANHNSSAPGGAGKAKVQRGP